MERLLFPLRAAPSEANRLQRYEKSRHRKDADSKMKLLSIALLAWQKYGFLQKSYKFATFNCVFFGFAFFVVIFLDFAALTTSSITDFCAFQMAV